MADKYKQILDLYKLPIALSFVGIVLIAGGIFASSITKNPSGQSFPKESLIQDQKMISVDVSGSVMYPGVYKVNEGARIEDAIKMAGGFSEKANGEYVSKYLNMAQKLSDGTKIYVPFVGEVVSGVSGGGIVAGTQTQAKININTAAQSELEALPGIGPATASKIISYRPYQEIGDLISKKVVGKAVFEKIKDSIVVY